MAFSKKTIAVSLVLVGAALSIISVFIYNQVINKNHDEIKKLESSVIEKDEIIKSIWQNSISLENKKDISLTMLLTNQGERSLVDKFIKENFKRVGINVENIPQIKNEAFSFLTKMADNKKEEILERINNLYLEKVVIQEKISDRKRKIDKFSLMALFMQIIGLMLILSKDLVYFN